MPGMAGTASCVMYRMYLHAAGRIAHCTLVEHGPCTRHACRAGMVHACMHARAATCAVRALRVHSSAPDPFLVAELASSGTNKDTYRGEHTVLPERVRVHTGHACLQLHARRAMSSGASRRSTPSSTCTRARSPAGRRQWGTKHVAVPHNLRPLHKAWHGVAWRRVAAPLFR